MEVIILICILQEYKGYLLIMYNSFRYGNFD